MSIINNSIIAGASGQAGGAGEANTIERSLRFNAADSAHLSKDFGSAGNRKTWTWSGWVKRNNLSTRTPLFGVGTAQSDSSYFAIEFEIAGDLRVQGWNTLYVKSNDLFRDPSAWYHLVVAVDTTQLSASDQVRVYKNGTLVTKAVETAITQNTDLPINSTSTHYIGYQPVANVYGDSMLADVHFIDGSALNATDFGSFDDNGIWQPKAYTGTYPGNSFHLDFADNSSAAALGYDAAGSNDWTVNNITTTTTSYTTANSITSSGGLNNPQRILDGTVDADATIPSGAAWIEFNPPVGISYSSSVEVMGPGSPSSPYNARWQLNNGSLINTVNANSWVTLATGSGTITTIRLQTDSGGLNWRGIRVDGVILKEELTADIDSLRDSPTNGDTANDTGLGGEVPGNYPTLNPLDHNTGGSTFSEGNLKIQTPTTSGGVYVSTMATPTTGKWYAEATMVALSQNIYSRVGLVQVGQPRNTNQLGNSAGQIAYIVETGEIRYNLTALATGGSAASAGDIIGMALDLDNQTLKIYKNGVLQVTASSIPQYEWFFAGSDDYQVYSATHEWNFGQRPFAYPISGYKPLATPFLPTPAIEDGSDYMDVVTYTGNGSTRTISGFNFSPDFVWAKSRSNVNNHYLFDTVRGATNRLESNTTQNEAANSGLTQFNSDGYNIGADSSMNANNWTYVNWVWDAGSSTVSNTAGSITSQVRANPTAGFSIVTYTGTGVNATVGHGLGVAPGMIIVKMRTDAGYNWVVYHKNLTSAAYALGLETTNAEINSPTSWNSTDPTSSVFSIGTRGSLSQSSKNFVAYCFAPIEGYSAFGSYTGNLSTNGPFVYTGFRPKYVLVKNVTSSNHNWQVHDSSRDPYNVMNKRIFPNTSAQEYDTLNIMDFLSNGFKLRIADATWNENGSNFVYAAFAENPFKYSRAR